MHCAAEPRDYSETLQRINILGIPVDNVTLDEAVERIAQFIDSNYPHQVLTINPEFVIQARRHRAFRATLLTGDLVVPDGAGITLAAWLQGRRLPGRVPGVELVEALAEEGVRRGWSFFLLGAAPGVAERTARILQIRYPGLIIAGTFAGSPHPEDEDRITAIIRSAQPDVLLVAYGAPAQDLWIKRNQLRIGVPVAIGVGGTFDYLSGVVPRAPALLRRLGLEWLYRLIKQPWRWRRMLALPQFAAAAMWEAMLIRAARLRRRRSDGY